MQNERLAAGGLGCKVVFVSSVSSHRSFMRRTRTLLALRSARYLRGHALVLQTRRPLLSGPSVPSAPTEH